MVYKELKTNRQKYFDDLDNSELAKSSKSFFPCSCCIYKYILCPTKDEEMCLKGIELWLESDPDDSFLSDIDKDFYNIGYRLISSPSLKNFASYSYSKNKQNKLLNIHIHPHEENIILYSIKNGNKEIVKISSKLKDLCNKKVLELRNKLLK